MTKLSGDTRWLALAEHISSWSKDPSTRVGCVLVDDHQRIISTGYNGFPKGIADDDRLNNREEKYKLVVHAEANALLYRTLNIPFTLYTTHFPCHECAKLICQTECKRVVATCYPERWKESCNDACKMFKEVGIIVNVEKR